MAEYIERDAFIEWLKRIPLIDLSDGRGICRVIMEDDFKKAITKMPKSIIVDAVPVVRCKDCKYQTSTNLGYWCDRKCCLKDCAVYPNYYCADGERKDEKKCLK